jgi:hypothetical protein
MHIGIHESETKGLVVDALASAGLTDVFATVLFGG